MFIKKKIVQMVGAGLLATAAMFAPLGQAEASDMDTFKAAYSQVPQDVEYITANIVLFSPSFHADTNLSGICGKSGFAWLGGNIHWSNTNLKTEQTEQADYPIYMEKSGNRLNVYGQTGGRWLRESIADLPLWILDLLKTQDQALLAANADAVKSVAATDMGEKVQMNIVLDKDKLAAIAKTRSNNPYLAEALGKNDVSCTWVIEKSSQRTLTIGADLTKVMQSYAQAVLEASYQSKIKLSKRQSDLYQTLGYYSTLQVYCSSQNKYDQNAYNEAMNQSNRAKGAAVSGSLLDRLIEKAVTTTLKK